MHSLFECLRIPDDGGALDSWAKDYINFSHDKLYFLRLWPTDSSTPAPWRLHTKPYKMLKTSSFRSFLQRPGENCGLILLVGLPYMNPWAALVKKPQPSMVKLDLPDRLVRFSGSHNVIHIVLDGFQSEVFASSRRTMAAACRFSCKTAQVSGSTAGNPACGSRAPYCRCFW